ncbi:hypothetical protein F2B00_01615 [Streptomyces parvus]|uniref:hypothetical protein n=1 Tax=Streptomyces parvus TaxID=66428 RepID=UPI0012397C45|nr:hypothetical protein [Streptomyces parvus]KAA6203977.1 hypothetical protein F2B00_01615 [Streptomyces parvus]
MGEDDRENAVCRVREAYAEQRLSRAVIAYPVVDIELRLGVGNAGVTVPRDAIVEVEGLTTGWKDLRYRPRQPSRPDAPRIRISGEMGYGRLKIRHAWR